jgi:hypothetical protein
MNMREFFRWLGPHPLMQTPEASEVFVVAEDGWIKAIDGPLPDPLFDWVGEPLSLLQAQYPSLKLQVIKASLLEQAWRKKEPALSFFQEWRRLANQVFLEEKRKKPAVHPFLAGFQSPWLQVLPRHFTMYICVSGHQEKHALFEIKQGQLIDFSIPDFQSLETAKTASLEERVEHLRRNRSEAVQGVRLGKEFWTQLMQSPQPWGLLTKGLKKGAIQLAPKRLSFYLWLRLLQSPLFAHSAPK